MTIVDENIVASQRLLLRSWRMRFRRIGKEIGKWGIGDNRVIAHLHHLARPTFFTRDIDFFRQARCHSHYCLVHLDVREQDAATYIRRVLRHPSLNAFGKRSGTVIQTSPDGLKILRKNVPLQTLQWLVYPAR